MSNIDFFVWKLKTVNCSRCACKHPVLYSAVNTTKIYKTLNSVTGNLKRTWLEDCLKTEGNYKRMCNVGNVSWFYGMLENFILFLFISYLELTSRGLDWLLKTRWLVTFLAIHHNFINIFLEENNCKYDRRTGLGKDFPD